MKMRMAWSFLLAAREENEENGDAATNSVVK
jgi:hypothetical protein